LTTTAIAYLQPLDPLCPFELPSSSFFSNDAICSKYKDSRDTNHSLTIVKSSSPTMLIPTYPSSALNNYYYQSNSFIYRDQNNAHTFAPITSDFYDPHVLPPSASQTHIPTIRRTPSVPSRPISSIRSLQNQIDTISHSSPNNVPLTPFIFQSPPSNDARTQSFNIAQPQRHPIFSPPIMNSPITAYSSSPCPHSIHLTTPIPSPINIVAPQPVHGMFPDDKCKVCSNSAP
jgi:hypothetical protein